MSFVRAAHNRDIKLLTELLSNGTDINVIEEGWTALGVVVGISNNDGYLDLVKLLLDYGANPNIPNLRGETPLLVSTGHTNTTSNIETVKLLLDYGADPNIANNNGTTPLMMAGGNSNVKSNVETVKLLLDYGADPNAVDFNSATVLTIASMLSGNTSNLETVKLLLDYGADPFVKNNLNSIAIDYCPTPECTTLISNYMFKSMYTNDKKLAEQYSKTGDMKLPKEVWELILLRKRQRLLCKELSNDQNRELLLAFASMLEIPISDNITKQKLCGIISEQLVWGGKYSLDSSVFTGKRYKELKESLIKLAYHYGIDIHQPIDKILTEISSIL